MKYLFTKLSEPGYELQFDTQTDVLMHLLPRTCTLCKLEAKSLINKSNLTAEMCNEELLYELLGTSCGCEYMLEGLEDET